jgi:hypothetical protein
MPDDINQLNWNGKPVKMGFFNRNVFNGLCSNKLSANGLLSKFINGRKIINTEDICTFSKIRVGSATVTAYIYEYDDHISIENISFK